MDESAGLRVKEIGIQNIDASLTRKSLRIPQYDRQLFYDDCAKLSPDSFVNKYAPITVKVKIKRWGRETIHALHMHNAMRKIVHRVRKIKKKIGNK